MKERQAMSLSMEWKEGKFARSIRTDSTVLCSISSGEIRREHNKKRGER
jgi:hypothetical protein